MQPRPDRTRPRQTPSRPPATRRRRSRPPPRRYPTRRRHLDSRHGRRRRKGRPQARSRSPHRHQGHRPPERPHHHHPHPRAHRLRHPRTRTRRPTVRHTTRPRHTPRPRPASSHPMTPHRSPRHTPTRTAQTPALPRRTGAKHTDTGLVCADKHTDRWYCPMGWTLSRWWQHPDTFASESAGAQRRSAESGVRHDEADNGSYVARIDGCNRLMIQHLHETVNITCSAARRRIPDTRRSGVEGRPGAIRRDPADPGARPGPGAPACVSGPGWVAFFLEFSRIWSLCLRMR